MEAEQSFEPTGRSLLFRVERDVVRSLLNGCRVAANLSSTRRTDVATRLRPRRQQACDPRASPRESAQRREVLKPVAQTGYDQPEVRGRTKASFR